VNKTIEIFKSFQASAKPQDAALLSVRSMGHYRSYSGFKVDRSLGHSVEHLIYTLDGTATGIIAGKQSVAKAGSIWLMPKDLPYQYWCEDQSGFWEGRWVEYDGAWVRPLWNMMGLEGITHIPECFEAQSTVEELHSRLQTDGNHGLHEASALLWKFFTILERHLAGLSQTKVRFSGIEAAQRHVHEHLSDPITIDDLAHIANLSPFHFSRVFLKKTGFTPAKYVRSIRIGRARELLLEGELSIKQIAQAVGVPQAHHFSAVFKQATGQSPRAFVRTHRGIDQNK
jgi:AraC-like DNA-binding protein